MGLICNKSRYNLTLNNKHQSIMKPKAIKIMFWVKFKPTINATGPTWQASRPLVLQTELQEPIWQIYPTALWNNKQLVYHNALKLNEISHFIL